MDELTESARQCLVSQGIITGTLSILNSLGLLLMGTIVITRANDLLQFTSLTHLAILEVVCGLSSLLSVVYLWWITASYRNRQLEIRSKYLDENMTKGLLALILPLLITFSAFIVSAVFMLLKADSSGTYDLKSAMTFYSTDITRKVILDKLQILLSCCGSQSLLDWFMIDWQNTEVTPGENSKNDSLSDWDSVPYSCCCPEAPPPCVHHQLRVFGVGSLYTEGCADKLDEAVFTFIAITLIMLFFSVFLMVLIMYTSRKLQTSARSALKKGDATAPGAWWLLAPSCSNDNNINTETTVISDHTPLLSNENKRTRDQSERHSDRIRTVGSTSLVDYWCKPNQVIMNPVLVTQKSKVMESTLNENWNLLSKNAYESSEDWTRKAFDVSGSTSTTSFMTTSRPNNSTSESRRSVSDTAVANLEVSHHFEHKVRPLYRM